MHKGPPPNADVLLVLTKALEHYVRTDQVRILGYKAKDIAKDLLHLLPVQQPYVQFPLHRDGD
jgi:hypothetical protein